MVNRFIVMLYDIGDNQIDFDGPYIYDDWLDACRCLWSMRELSGKRTGNWADDGLIIDVENATTFGLGSHEVILAWKDFDWYMQGKEVDNG